MLNYIEIFEEHLREKFPKMDAEMIKVYALLSLVTKGKATNENTHDAWASWQNRTNPNHKSLIPFEDLSLEVQELDQPYTDAINATWHELMSY